MVQVHRKSRGIDPYTFQPLICVQLAITLESMVDNLNLYGEEAARRMLGDALVDAITKSEYDTSNVKDKMLPDGRTQLSIVGSGL